MTTPNRRRAASLPRIIPTKAPPAWRKRIARAAAGVLLVAALSGCACRPAFVGPYGGFHPTRCYPI